LETTKSPTQPSPPNGGRAFEAKVSPTGGDPIAIGLEGAAAFAAIFDMDGTLINNTPYHFKSWQALLKKYNKPELSKETYYTEISGVPVLDTIRKFFGADHDEVGLKALLKEKEEFYRSIYAPDLAPIKGLEDFLTALKNAGVKMAMATSATIEDVDFIMDHIPIRNDFNDIVNSSMVGRPKPNPDIFLKAAEKLNMPASKCIVFEDSLAGIKAGNNAGMKVVGITTGHPAAELQPVNMVINDYSGLTVQILAALFE
jgi:beta-phosphoglucomutase family hydrolase